jgi:hypothetical protein
MNGLCTPDTEGIVRNSVGAQRQCRDGHDSCAEPLCGVRPNSALANFPHGSLA